MKHINFSVWWWYVYQWRIGVLLYLCIKNYNIVNSNEKIKSLKEIIFNAFNNNGNIDLKKIDMLLEGDINCFEDINLLCKSWHSTKSTILFFQVKWKNTILSDWKDNDWKVLNKKDSIYLFSNFLDKNQNIYRTSNKSDLIIISNKKFNQTLHRIVNPLTNEESDIREKIISEVLIKYKNKIKVRNMRKLEKCVIDILEWKEINKILYWTMWPFFSESDQEEILLFIKNTKAIMMRTKIIESISLNIIIDIAEKELWKTKSQKIFNEIANKSIDIDWIESSKIEFRKYLKYYDIHFLPDKTIDKLDWINKWKFIKI